LKEGFEVDKDIFFLNIEKIGTVENVFFIMILTCF